MDPSRFLNSLAQSLSTMALYKPGHPARERVIDRSFALLNDVLLEDKHPEFSFLGDEVVYGAATMREMRDWEWSKRFSALGIQRLEIDSDVTRDDFVGFLELVASRLATPGAPVDTAEVRQMTTRQRIRYGEVGIRTDDE